MDEAPFLLLGNVIRRNVGPKWRTVSAADCATPSAKHFLVFEQ